MKIQAKTSLPTSHGKYWMYAFSDDNDDKSPHIALVHQDYDPDGVITVRIHSECLTGDLLGSLRCDCGEQLEKSLEIIERDKGVLIYLRQEGRGIGLINKMRAYELQDKGLNTIEANIHLGFEPDERDYRSAIEMLETLKICKIKLITNNPEKLSSLSKSDIEVVERVPIIIEAKSENQDYLDIKKTQMGHLLD